MLLSIAGSQGSGKSTLLEELSKLGFNTVDRKTSRSILSDWGVTLQEVNTNSDLTIKFQDEILSRKMSDEAEAVASKDVWFTERTYADLFTYALVSLGHNNDFSAYIDQYYNACRAAQETHTACFYLQAGKFPVAADGVRGSNQHYSRMVDLVMYDILEAFSRNQLTRPFVVDVPHIDDRVKKVLSVVHDMYGCV